MNNEEWRDIKGYEGLYQVSSLGRVKTLNYRKHGREKILKPIIHKYTGYCVIGLTKENKQKQYKIHRLVAEAFLNNPNNYPVINHKDEDKTNNNINNLEWCSQAYNINYGTRNRKVGEKLSKLRKGNNVPRDEKGRFMRCC